ncbi:MAG: hypothetical protein CMG41_07030 [Candidatus Marinimicrobia bacterium]|nr:hypothetical protein [Candidatus Neomarinimicrobiota bacterium]
MKGSIMYVAKNFPLVIIFSSLFAFKPLPKQSDSYSKNISKKNLEVLYNKSCSTNKNSFNKVQPSEFPSDYSTQRDRNVEIPINYHVIYVAGDSIYMNVTVDNQPYPHCNWDIRDNDNNTFLLYPGFEFDYPGHSYSIGGILPPGNYSLFLYDEFGTGGVAATVTTSSGQVLASVNMGSWGNYTFLDFIAPEGDYVNGLVSTEVIEEQTEVLNNAYNDFGYTFVTSNIDSAVNAGWYYATDSHKFETGQWDNTDQYLAMAQAMTIDVTQSINYFWTGARQTSGLGVHPWSFPEDDSRHGLFCGNYTVPGGEPGLNLGITGVHEVGHYLGLYHTFENGCSSPGDEVEDTPYQSEANYSCPTSNYSCGSYDDIGNYMDYMDDECLTHFTQGQKDRIDWAIETYRPILLENTTLDYAGPVWHVATTGSDDNDGSEGSPFVTIQAGIDAASDGDTVLVGAGTYVENLDVEIGSDYYFAGIVLCSEFVYYPDSTSIIENTIIAANSISSNYGDNTFYGFTIKDNDTPTNLNFYYSNSTFKNCFFNNVYDGGVSGTDSTVFQNCTLFNSFNDWGGRWAIVHNSILISSFTEDSFNDFNDGHNMSFTYNDLGYNENGNISDVNPLFCDSENGDYTLAANSPLVGAGENGVNMGALGVGCDSINLQSVWHVAVTGSDETGDGTELNPFATIEKAEQFANQYYNGSYENILFNSTGQSMMPGWNVTDTILVHAGTYHIGELRNTSNDYESDLVTIIQSVSGPDSTFLNPINEYSHIGGTLASYDISGFTISELELMYFASFIYLNNCIIKEMSKINGSSCGLDYCFGFENVTFVQNDNYESYDFNGYPLFYNSIIYDNENFLENVLNNEGTGITFTLNDIGLNVNGNTVMNPLFCDPENESYSLAENSPALGAGENGANMGALGV